MNNQTTSDLTDLLACVESLQKDLPKMTLKTKVDVAARLNAVNKSIEKIVEAVKDDVYKQRKGKEGMVIGELFKAVLKFIPMTRLNQKKLEVEDTTTWNKYRETKDESRITFEVR